MALKKVVVRESVFEHTTDTWGFAESTLLPTGSRRSQSGSKRVIFSLILVYSFDLVDNVSSQRKLVEVAEVFRKRGNKERAGKMNGCN